MSGEQQIPQLSLPIKEKDVAFKNYIIAIFDIQGQTGWLHKMEAIPKSQEEMQTFELAVRETLGAVCLFRTLFNTYFKAYLEAKNDLCMPGNHECETEVDPLEVGFQGFSDTIIIFIPKENRNGKIQWRAIHALFASCSILMPMLLSKEIVVRGGIELGIGTEFIPGEIYGPVLSQAYYLENEVAVYPRIVVGRELSKWIDLYFHKIRQMDVDAETLEKHINWLITDFDGVKIVDYLGLSAKLIGSKVTQGYIRTALSIACHRREYFSDKDEGLFNKYDLLIKYFNLKGYGSS